MNYYSQFPWPIANHSEHVGWWKNLGACQAYKYLRVWITNDLSWARQTQIEENYKRTGSRDYLTCSFSVGEFHGRLWSFPYLAFAIGMLCQHFYKYCSTGTLKCLYVTFVCPHLEHVVPVTCVGPTLDRAHWNAKKKVQTFALKVCTKSWISSYGSLLLQTDLRKLDQRRMQLKLSFLFQSIHNSCTNYLS